MRMPKSSSFSVRDILDLPRSQADTSINTPVQTVTPPDLNRFDHATSNSIRNRLGVTPSQAEALRQREQFTEELRKHQQLKQVDKYFKLQYIKCNRVSQKKFMFTILERRKSLLEKSFLLFYSL